MPQGVKELVDEGVSQVPDEYIRVPDPRPKREAAGSIPVIDLSELQSKGGRQRVIQALHAACSSWGFFQLTGHKFPEELVTEMLQQVHQMFNLPSESKLAFYSEDHLRGFRYSTSFVPSKESVRQWQDHLHQSISPVCPPDDLPLDPPLYRETSLAYGQRMKSLSEQLMELFSESMGLDTGALRDKFAGERLTMRMNYYPPCPRPDQVLGLDPHSDPNAFTILLQVSEGLQVFYDGAWTSIKPLSGAFVVNVGDQLQILSNDLFKSSEHRAVVNSSKTRVTIATFYGPSPSAVISPMPQLVSHASPAQFKESFYGDYIKAFYARGLNSKSALDTVRI